MLTAVATLSYEKGLMLTETLITGTKVGYSGINPGRSICGEPPTALSTLAAIVMCNISSITTLRTVLASKDVPFFIEYRAARYNGTVECSSCTASCNEDRSSDSSLGPSICARSNGRSRNSAAHID